MRTTLALLAAACAAGCGAAGTGGHGTGTLHADAADAATLPDAPGPHDAGAGVPDQDATQGPADAARPGPDSGAQDVGVAGPDLLPDLPGADGPGDDAPDAADDPGVDLPLEIHPGGGVHGTVTLLSGDCMPPAPPTCAQAEVIGAGDIFFLDIVTGKGFAAWWEEGTYQVLLPDGEYYVWPDIGWGAGIVAPACWLDLAQCSPGDLAFVQGEFDYMAGQAKCTQDALWDSHDRCNVVIAGCTIQLDIQIDNVAY